MGILVTCLCVCIVYFGLIHLPFTFSSPYWCPFLFPNNPFLSASSPSLILKSRLYGWEKISDIWLPEPGLFHLAHCSAVLSFFLKMDGNYRILLFPGWVTLDYLYCITMYYIYIIVIIFPISGPYFPVSLYAMIFAIAVETGYLNPITL